LKLFEIFISLATCMLRCEQSVFMG